MKIAVVGTGMIVHMFMPHFAEWGVEVAAVYGRSADKVAEVVDQVGGTAYTDYAQMLAEAEVDAVYIAMPNALHYAFTKQALEAGHNVILEKPITACIEEAEELAALARSKDLLLYEAVSTIYLPNYLHVREFMKRIGTVKIATLNYSQYSSRYDAFRAGTVMPAFDPAKAGGALMDLGLYNMQYAIGLFGEPQSAAYHANVERGIDTSGIMDLDYGSFKVVCIAAKDCGAPSRIVIQGTDGYILQNCPPNGTGEVVLHLNDGTEEHFDQNPATPWESEFKSFAQGIAAHDTETCYQMLDHSLAVCRTMTNARRSAGVIFPNDEPYL